MPLLKLAPVAGLDALQPSQEEDANWGVTPPPPPSPPTNVARMATASATAGGESGGTQSLNPMADTAYYRATGRTPDTSRVANVVPGDADRPGFLTRAGNFVVNSAGFGTTDKPGEDFTLGGAGVTPFQVGTVYKAGQDATRIPALEDAASYIKNDLPALRLSSQGILVPDENRTVNKVVASQLPTTGLDLALTAAPFAGDAAAAAKAGAKAAGEGVARIGTRALEGTAPTLEGVVRPTIGPDALLRGTAMPEVVNPTRPVLRTPSVAGGAALKGDAEGAFPFGPRGNPANDVPLEDDGFRFGRQPSVSLDASGSPIVTPAAKPATDLIAGSAEDMAKPPTAPEPPMSDLEAAFQQSLKMAEKDPAAAREAFRKAAEAVTAQQQADQAAKGAEYATATRLSRRAAEMAGESPEAMRKKAISLVSGALEDDSHVTPGIGGGADVPENQPGGFGWLRGGAANVGKNVAAIPGEVLAQKAAYSPLLLRQGKLRLVTDPVAAVQEFIKSMRVVFNEGKARELMDGVINDDFIRDTKTAAGREATAADRFNRGLGVAGPGDPVSKYSGYTWVDVGGSIPDWGPLAQSSSRVEERSIAGDAVGDTVLGRKLRGNRIYQASDRQAAVELALHRLEWYRAAARAKWDSGERNIREFVRLRELIEHATQRGDVPKVIANLPLFTSARAQSGRALFLWDLIREVPKGIVTGKVLSPGVEREAAKALVGMVTFNMVQMSAMAALGLGAIEYKGGLPVFRRGPHHDDPWAGWNAPVKFVLGVAHDAAKEGGIAKKQGAEQVPQDFISRVGNRSLEYGYKGFSPVYGTALATARRKDFKGAPYNLAEEAKSGRLASDLTLPFVADEAVAAAKEGSPVAALAELGPSFLSEGLSSYTSLPDLRNDAAKKLGAKDYNSATPLVKEQIDKQPEIAQFAADNGSDYQRSKQAVEQSNPVIQEARRSEDSFQKNVPIDTAIRDKWHDEGIARQAIAGSLANQFKKMFDNFNETTYSKAITDYYAIKKTDTDGNFDFDATTAAQQDWLASQPKDVQQWVDEALQVSRDKQTPLRQQYLDYIDQRKALGYFDLDPTAKDYTKKREALDAAHPGMDVANAYWGGDIKDKKPPTLNSSAAVDLALQQHPDRPIYLKDVSRPINQDEGTVAAWAASKKAISIYQNPPEALLDKEAQAKFKKSYASLDTTQQGTVKSAIHSQMQDDIPQLDAWLAWWGIGLSDKTATFNTTAAVAEFKKIAEKYGKTAPVPGMSFKVAQ